MSIVKALIGQRDSTELASSEEINVSSDLVGTKGISFEGLDTYTLEKVGGVLKEKYPNYSVKPTYASDNLTKLEVFNGYTQTEINRVLSCDVSYTNDLVTSEIWRVYDTSNGTTILVTRTITYSYTNDVLTNMQVSES